MTKKEKQNRIRLQSRASALHTVATRLLLCLTEKRVPRSIVQSAVKEAIAVLAP